MTHVESTIYTKKVGEPWFSLIATGSKTVEGRLHRDDWKEMKEGDIIDFTNDEFGFLRKHRVKITRTKTYSTFERYLRGERICCCLPTVNKIAHGVAIYRKFYSEADEYRYGVVAIRISDRI